MVHLSYFLCVYLMFHIHLKTSVLLMITCVIEQSYRQKLHLAIAMYSSFELHRHYIHQFRANQYNSLQPNILPQYIVQHLNYRYFKSIEVLSDLNLCLIICHKHDAMPKHIHVVLNLMTMDTNFHSFRELNTDISLNSF
jgi:hypothetical protein